jgi:hypothetical protein
VFSSLFAFSEQLLVSSYSPVVQITRPGVSRGELDELTALRSDQYAKALADNRAFQRRYMVEVQILQRRKPPRVIYADEGIRPAVLTRSRSCRRPRATGCTRSPPRPTPPTAPLVPWSPPWTGRGNSRVAGAWRGSFPPGSLIFGHPQGPTGLPSVAELIEELRQRGGGVGLLTGCAAGDTGAAVVVRVDD